jgi:hypothetical protein
MATTQHTERRSLYPPSHRPSDDPYYVDDTLDAYPPYHLLRGKPTPEAMEAAKRLAAERGYPPPQFPSEPQDAPAPAPASPETQPANGALSNRARRTAGAGDKATQRPDASSPRPADNDAQTRSA